MASSEIHLPTLITDQYPEISRSEARRLIAQGGVKVQTSTGPRYLHLLDYDPRHIEGKTLTVGRKRSFVVGGGEPKIDTTSRVGPPDRIAVGEDRRRHGQVRNGKPGALDSDEDHCCCPDHGPAEDCPFHGIRYRGGPGRQQ